MKDGFPKLNYNYAAQLLLNFELRSEFMKLVGENIKKKIPDNSLVIDDLVKFCIQRIYDPPFINKKDTMELSYNSAKHLASYIHDHKDYANDDVERRSMGREIEWKKYSRRS